VAKLSKRIHVFQDKVEKGKYYSVQDAVNLLKEVSSVKFDESVEVAVNLGVDARKSDQQVRGSTVLPKGTGKTVRVAVFAEGENAKIAKAAGADTVGFEDLAKAIQEGDINYGVVIATPDAMPIVGKLGKALGPRGLMPNPKLGTVSADVKKAVKALKEGQIEIKNDKDGNIGASIGKKSFPDNKISENFNALIQTIQKEKPNGIKGHFILSSFLTSTMGISYKLKL